MSNLKVAVVFSLAFVFVVAQQDNHQHDGHTNMNHENHRVNVDVYYESLCPDSRKFFTQQLYPSLQGNLSNYVNLTLVPFGKATMEFKTNQYEFTCHHGPAECQGNKIQACALKVIDGGKKTDGLGFNRVAVGFINCLMDKTVRKENNATFPNTECATINHVNNLNSIENCAAHTDGSNELAVYGSLTERVQKPLKSVPTIVFNSELNADDNMLAQSNFVKALCKYIQGPKPNECNGSGNIRMSFTFLILLGIISKIFS